MFLLKEDFKTVVPSVNKVWELEEEPGGGSFNMSGSFQKDWKVAFIDHWMLEPHDQQHQQQDRHNYTLLSKCDVCSSLHALTHLVLTTAP